MVAALLGIDAVEESEYSLAHNRDISFVLNGNRLFKARCMVNIREEYFSHILAIICAVWFSTVVLLYGVFRNSAWCIWFWLFMLVAQLVGFACWLTVEYVNSSPFDDIKLSLMLYFSPEIVPWTIFVLFARYLQRVYKLTEKAMIAIPCPAPYYDKVALPREDRIVYSANNGYTHILSNI